jgi:hypothetical protein
MIYTENLYDHVLSKPIEEDGLNSLSIITGYSSPGMVQQHFNKINNPAFRINVIIGMGTAGLINHNYYKNIMENYQDRFSCYYYNEKKSSVHSKLYIWSNDDKYCAFAGSANYSNQAFFNSNRHEFMFQLDKDGCRQAISYYERIKNLSVICKDREIDQIINSQEGQLDGSPEEDIQLLDGTAVELETYNGLRRVRLSLLMRNGQSHKPGNGLNWNVDRPDRKDKNAAFIPTRDAKKWKFFPPWKEKYFIIQDYHDKDNTFFGQVEGTDGKNLSSAEDKQILGEWFRNKLGLKFGDTITKRHLLDYGKTYVDFHKVDDDTFLIDF